MKKNEFSLDKMKNIIYRTSLVILLGMFLYVLRYAFFEFQSMPFLNENTNMLQKGLLMGIGVATLGLVLFLVWEKMVRWKEKTCIGAIVILLFFLFLCQIAFLYAMKIQPRYDALKVLDEAVSLCKYGSVSDVHLDGYFARYTNNYPILFLTAGFLKMGRMLGLLQSDYQGAVFLLGFLNILAIDFAVLVTAHLLRKIFDVKGALFFVICVALNPLFIIWVPFYYTNTLAMPFIPLILYFFYSVFIEEQKSWKRKVICSFLLGTCIMAGIKIRATTVITVVACLLYFILADSKDKKKKQIIDGTKDLLVKVSFLCLGVLVVLCTYKVVEHKFVPFDYSDTAFPAIHWINMGAGGTGEYNIIDEQSTISYPTAEKKSAANWDSYKDRVQQMGIDGYLSLMLQKLKLTFADSGAGYRSELGVSDLYHDANMYLVGGKADGVGYLLQLQYVMSLLFLLYATVKLFFSKRLCSDFSVVIFWNIAGAFLFHMIWEAGNIYSLSFALLFPASMACATNMEEESFLYKNLKAVDIRKHAILIGRIGGGMVLLLTLAVAISIYVPATEKNYETNDAVVNQYIYHWGDDDQLLDGEEIVQSFYGNRSFNRLSFQVRNVLHEHNDGIYQVELLNEKKECLHTFEIKAKDYGDYDFIRLSVEEREGTGEKYYIRIYKTSGNSQSNLVFLSYRTGNYDAYSYGELEDGENLQDLCFSVYMTKENPYISKVGFGVVLFSVLLLEILLQSCIILKRS